MRRQEPPLPQDSVTYVAGLGFLSVCSTRVTLSAIRRNANLICLFLTLYLLSKNLLSLPLTYLVSYLGLPVQINPYTGMIYTTIFIKELIGSLSALSALFITTLACWLASRRALHGKRVFSKPYAGVTSLAVPVIVASSLLGALLSGIFHELTSFFGIILYTNPGYPELPLLSFGNSFFYILLSEILFRGILLARLRRFGDSFAVLAVSLICAFFSSGPVEAISAFLLGLSAGYFTIRSGGEPLALFDRTAPVAGFAICFPHRRPLFRPLPCMGHHPADRAGGCRCRPHRLSSFPLPGSPGISDVACTGWDPDQSQIGLFLLQLLLFIPDPADGSAGYSNDSNYRMVNHETSALGLYGAGTEGSPTGFGTGGNPSWVPDCTGWRDPRTRS